MLHGYHFIFSAYGFWLPNDPRGSWSDTVRAFDLQQFGPATKVTTTRSVAARPHDHQLCQVAKQALKHPPVKFTGEQVFAIAKGFAVVVSEFAYQVYALAILPDHVHIAKGHHERAIEKISGHLKSKATRQLVAEGIHSLQEFATKNGWIPTPWARNFWCLFIRTQEVYANGDSVCGTKSCESCGLRRQKWSLVMSYEG